MEVSVEVRVQAVVAGSCDRAFWLTCTTQLWLCSRTRHAAAEEFPSQTRTIVGEQRPFLNEGGCKVVNRDCLGNVRFAAVLLSSQ